MQRDERVTVQGPVNEQQPDGMSHGGGGACVLLFGVTAQGRAGECSALVPQS